MENTSKEQMILKQNSIRKYFSKNTFDNLQNLDPKAIYESNHIKTCLYPDYFQKALNSAPRESITGRLVIYLDKGDWVGRNKVIGCRFIKVNEMIRLMRELESESKYWNPKSNYWKAWFWIILLVGLCWMITILFIEKDALIKITLDIFIFILMITLLWALNGACHNFLLQREIVFKKKIEKLNTEYLRYSPTKIKVGPFGAWLEIVFDRDHIFFKHKKKSPFGKKYVIRNYRDSDAHELNYSGMDGTRMSDNSYVDLSNSKNLYRKSFQENYFNKHQDFNQ